MPPALGLMRATRLLQQFSPMVPATANAAVPGQTVAVLLVESGLWTRFTITRRACKSSCTSMFQPRASECW